LYRISTSFPAEINPPRIVRVIPEYSFSFLGRGEDHNFQTINWEDIFFQAPGMEFRISFYRVKVTYSQYLDMFSLGLLNCLLNRRKERKRMGSMKV